jgi:ubiquinone/menaquinone biosynthesis C-methylase UbiE
MENEDVKRNIISRYDHEAVEKENEAWLRAGGSARVPEKPGALYFVARKVSEALRLYGAGLRDKKALEVGCSFGQMTSLLASEVRELTAIDISPASVRLAEGRLRHYGVNNVRFAVEDAERLDSLEDGSFDVAFSFSTVRFCPNPQKALEAMRAKLKSGGVAIVDFPNANSPWHRFVKAAAGIAVHDHDNLYTPEKARALFERAGFRVEAVKVFLFTSRRTPTPLLPVFKALDFVLERTPVVRSWLGIILVKGVKA